MKKELNTVDKYIGSFSLDIQQKLKTVRELIKLNAPEAIESISYGMPAYKLNNKPLVYFGGFANHIGFYATPTGHQKFSKELSIYKQGKGSVQFPFNQPLPVNLITNIIIFRVSENSIK
ncbi:iron chaperone [Maribacter hydrothermalis]|uniref:YdhG-like domain-containing protein n=1 Tax=Maribacter hydrothermalis TaxID=1836467 RepID=A0A1B7Z855_9FLAO|nr:DUF1801 domain-containing protein [Maribacter hydrothermalis]APQ19113.1 hypothetical protein BTR34_18080 [Maribacter hydrothermalis]OBR38875.1 hypothetical protein A9200_04205 [Maribacter hydrothermalis]